MNTIAGGITSINDFNGTSKPIIGLFEEPIPETFFQEDLTKHYISEENYRTFFKITKSLIKDESIELYVINEADVTNDIVFSAVSLEHSFVKNFLVRVQENNFIAIDISALSHFDHILVLSMNPFDLQSDSEDFSNQLLVQPPKAKDDDLNDMNNQLADCYGQIGAYNVRVKNNATSESVTARVSLGYNATFGNLFMNVYYPIGGRLYHSAANPRTVCSPTSTLVDRYYTNSETGRYLRWTSMLGLLHGTRSAGKATCNSPTSGSNSCYVSGTTTLATWRITRL